MILIEKEYLAICSDFGKFDHWLYGKSDIEVHTDHQPLKTICKKQQYGSQATKDLIRSLPISLLPWQIERCLRNKSKPTVTVCHFFEWTDVDELDDIFI